MRHPTCASATPPSKLGAAFQSLEARRFASVSLWSGTSFMNASTDQFFGQVEIGDNGWAAGTETGYTGTYGTSQDRNYTQWDSDLSDGLDSGWRPLALSVNVQSSGNAYFVAGSASAMTFSAGTGLSFHQVRIAAEVDGSGYEVDLRSIVVGFYHDGSLVQQYSLDDFSANTMDASNEDPLSTGATVTTTASNINGVYVSGQVRLQAAQGYYPANDDLKAVVAVS